METHQEECSYCVVVYIGRFFGFCKTSCGLTIWNPSIELQLGDVI